MGNFGSVGVEFPKPDVVGIGRGCWRKLGGADKTVMRNR